MKQTLEQVNVPDKDWRYSMLESAAPMPSNCRHPYVNIHVMYHAPWKVPIIGKTVKGAIRVKTIGPFYRSGKTPRSELYRARQDISDRIAIANQEGTSPADF